MRALQLTLLVFSSVSAADFDQRAAAPVAASGGVALGSWGFLPVRLAQPSGNLAVAVVRFDDRRGPGSRFGWLVVELWRERNNGRDERLKAQKDLVGDIGPVAFGVDERELRPGTYYVKWAFRPVGGGSAVAVEGRSEPAVVR